MNEQTPKITLALQADIRGKICEREIVVLDRKELQMKRKIYEIIESKFEDKRVFGVWYSPTMPNGNKLPENYLQVLFIPSSTNVNEFVRTFESNEFTEDSGINNCESQEVYEIIRQKGILRLQEELNIIEPTSDLTVAYNIILRAWNREFIGQSDNGLCIKDLSRILKISERSAYIVLLQLESEKLIGLRRNQVISYQEQEETFQFLELITGHNRIIINEFEGWRCSHCKQSGDHYEESKVYPCVIQQKRTVEQMQ